jgi:hypothetical protein
MSYKIYKYTFQLEDVFSVSMPVDSRILKIGHQPGYHKGIYSMWALVDVANEMYKRRFKVYGTGHDVDKPSSLRYIDTVIDGFYVWHFFEEKDA